MHRQVSNQMRADCTVNEALEFFLQERQKFLSHKLIAEYFREGADITAGRRHAGGVGSTET